MTIAQVSPQEKQIIEAKCYTSLLYTTQNNVNVNSSLMTSVK